MTKNQLEEEIIQRMENFYKASSELSEITGHLTPQLQDAFLDSYPFDKSFNDLTVDIYRWVEKVKADLG